MRSDPLPLILNLQTECDVILLIREMHFTLVVDLKLLAGDYCCLDKGDKSIDLQEAFDAVKSFELPG